MLAASENMIACKWFLRKGTPCLTSHVFKVMFKFVSDNCLKPRGYVAPIMLITVL